MYLVSAAHKSAKYIAGPLLLFWLFSQSMVLCAAMVSTAPEQLPPAMASDHAAEPSSDMSHCGDVSMAGEGADSNASVECCEDVLTAVPAAGLLAFALAGACIAIIMLAWRNIAFSRLYSNPFFRPQPSHSPPVQITFCSFLI